MGERNIEIESKLESHKQNILENIDKAKTLGINKVTAILVINEAEEEINREILNWLIWEGYKVSLKKEEYNILTVEW